MVLKSHANPTANAVNGRHLVMNLAIPMNLSTGMSLRVSGSFQCPAWGMWARTWSLGGKGCLEKSATLSTLANTFPTCVFWGGKMVAMNPNDVPIASYCCNARCLSCDSDVDSQWDWSLTEVSAFGHCPIGRIFWYVLPCSGHGYWLRHVETTLPPQKKYRNGKHLAFLLGPEKYWDLCTLPIRVF